MIKPRSYHSLAVGPALVGVGLAVVTAHGVEDRGAQAAARAAGTLSLTASFLRERKKNLSFSQNLDS